METKNGEVETFASELLTLTEWQICGKYVLHLISVHQQAVENSLCNIYGTHSNTIKWLE